LQNALDEVVRRHEVLRTTLRCTTASLFRSSAHAACSYPAVDFSHLPEAQREAEWKQFADEESKLPFNLETGRSCAHSFCASMPMIIYSSCHAPYRYRALVAGAALGRVECTVSCLYVGEPSPLSDLPFQYADYAVWQRNWLQGEELEAQVSYWRNRLSGAPPFSGASHGPSASRDFAKRGAALRRELDSALVESLTADSAVMKTRRST